MAQNTPLVLDVGEFRQLPVGNTLLLGADPTASLEAATKQYVDNTTTTTGGLTLFGDGSDGALVFDGTNTYAGIETHTGSAPNFVYTLARDIFATSITVASGDILNTGGFRIYCTGTITNLGTIRNNGGNGNNASGQSGGTTGTPAGAGTTYFVATPNTGSAGGVGSNTSPTAGGNATVNGMEYAYSGANTSTYGVGGNGGKGGDGIVAGGLGGGRATVTAPSSTLPQHVALQAHDLWVALGSSSGAFNLTTAIRFPGYACHGQPGSGGGGGKVASNGGGGAGGSGGGVCFICAAIITNTGATISANGGNGGNAASANGGVGGGGGGGTLILIYHALNTGTETAAGGANGTTGSTTNSVAAAAGTVVKVKV